MNDDSAEWMAMFKASGQLRPVPHEGIGGEDDEAHLGLVTTSNDEGRQVLGTCWPERWLTFKAALRELLSPPRREQQ